MNQNLITWFFYGHPLQIAKDARVVVLFFVRLYSLDYLPRHLFDAWHKDTQGYGRGFDLEKFLSIWGWNLASRLIGAIVRSVVLITGFLSVCATVLVAILFILLWYSFPVLLAWMTARSLS
ncbi:MAG TPA: hypothetical protein VEA59_01685 [Patescibacteria group bacterium]|nr:hypothetical protein [Patescibacteria group bacterium]